MARFSAANVRAGSAVGLRGSKPPGADARRRNHSQAARTREGSSDSGRRSPKAAAGAADAAERPVSRQAPKEERHPPQRILRMDEADIRLARQLQEEEERALSAEVAEDLEVARRLQAEEERNQDAEDDQEDDDAAFAQLLHAEQQRQAQAAARDGALAATLQYEHGRAGRLLARACELDEFLEAPLGSAPLPKRGDLHPDTMRRLVLRTLESSRRGEALPGAASARAGKPEAPETPKQRTPIAGQDGPLRRKSPFGVTGSAIAVGCRTL